MNHLNDIKFVDQPEDDPKWKSIFVNTAKLVIIFIITVLITELLLFFGTKHTSIVMVYVLSVLVISRVTPSYSYGIIAALISTFACDFLITAPRFGFSFTIGVPITLFIMMIVTLFTSAMTIQTKTQAKLATEREQRTHLLYEINQKILLARDVKTIVTLTNEYLIAHLQRPVIFYVKDPTLFEEEAYSEAGLNDNPNEIFHDESEKRLVHRVFRYGADQAKRTFDDVDDKVYYEPIVSNEKVLGVIGVDCTNKKLSLVSIDFLRMLISQVTLALELKYLADEQNNILLENEKEKTRGTLLRAISHDLRTPLTSILGAGSAILEQKDISNEDTKNLVKGICENTQWLIRVVENVLAITRLSGDNLKLTKIPEAAEEVIAQSASIVRKRFPRYLIHVHTPDELLIVPMDATLISQVIINLLENAVTNSSEDSLILLTLEKKGKYAKFEVSDNGKGIVGHLIGRLFETRPRKMLPTIDAAHGMGIGLSICQTIIHAHGGTIEGHNKEKGGASFSFQLPIEESEVHE